MLTPDIGPSLLFRPTAIEKHLSFVARIPGIGYLKHSGSDTRARDPNDWRPLEQYLGRDGGPPLAYFVESTRGQIEMLLGVGLEQAKLDDFGRCVETLHKGGASPPSFAHELSEEVLRTYHHGELVCELIMESALEATRRIHDRFDPDGEQRDSADAPTLSRLIERRFRHNYRHLVAGDGDQPALLTGDDDRNTLANCESRRKVTRYSREIPRDIRYWLWTRDIHSDDRGSLCPLQTPESQDVGYVRFLALGAGETDAADNPGATDEDTRVAAEACDLSAAASLIPFANHNDPARSSIGSKNLKQAVPVEGASAPRIRSGTETLIAERHGVARVPAGLTATVTEVFHDRIVAEREDGDEEVLPFGFAGPTGFGVDSRWRVLFKQGERLTPGAVCAHAPDVTLEGGRPLLALGSDVLVAFTPWHGMNYEDAIVVSDVLVDRFASTHLLRITDGYRSSEGAVWSVAEGAEVAAGDELLTILDGDLEPCRRVFAPEGGVVESVQVQTVTTPGTAAGTTERYSSVATVLLRVRRPLAVGDKLTNRHGSKGVVSMILPASEMPRLPDGRAVEMLLNPLGVIRRLNVGQLLEAHESLLGDLCGGGPRTVGRRMASHRRDELAEALAECGAPGGRLVLTCADSTRLDRHGGVVVGWQHMLKLDHLASDKLSHRMIAPSSPLDRQPAKGSTYEGGDLRGGAKRCGEMELWALRARGAHAFVSETLTARSGFRGADNPTLASVDAHLAVGQLALRHPTGEARLLDGRHTEPLPEDALAQILEPKAYGFTPTGNDEDPLYRSDLHGPAGAVACTCGDTTRSRHRCDRCHTVARPRPGSGRSQVRYHIALPVPIPHPWFASVAISPFTCRDEELELTEGHVAGSDGSVEFTTETGLRLRLTQKELMLYGDGDESVHEFTAPLPERPAEAVLHAGINRLFVLAEGTDGAWPEVTELDIAAGREGEFVRRWAVITGEPPPARIRLSVSPDGRPMISQEGSGEAPGGVQSPTSHTGSPLHHNCVPLLHVLPILPPGYRVLGYEPLDTRYKTLIRLSEMLRNGRSEVALKAVRREVHAILGTVNDRPADHTIAGRLSGKHGLIRRGLRGRRNNLVARSVIAPSAELGLEEVGLPLSTMAELELNDGDVVVVNRQPTLRPANVVALKAQSAEGSRFALHPLMSKQLAGDFDGDEATVHRPDSQAAARQCWNTMKPTAELLNDADGSPILTADLDFSLGLLLLSSNQTGRDEISAIAGTETVSEALGDGWSRGLSPGNAEELLRVLYRRLGDGSAGAAEKLFAAAARACVGWSASLLDDEFLSSGSRAQILGAAHGLHGMAGMQDAGWLGEAVAAGVAGSRSGLEQLLVKRGSLPTFVPDEPTADIPSCFLDGLESGELFATTSAALATLAQKKLVTPRAGNITKQLADALFDFEVTEGDCGDTRSPRTVLGCRVEHGCCAACVGELPSGRTVAVGERIGLRAALLVGERCTQKAMKTFHGGGTNVAVGGVVAALEAAFGVRSRHPIEGHISFSEAMKRADPAAALNELVNQTADLLDGGVHRSLIDVVVKRLRDAAEQHGTDLPLRVAGHRGHPLFDASIDGSLQTIVAAVGGAGSEHAGRQFDDLYLKDSEFAYQFGDFRLQLPAAAR